MPCKHLTPRSSRRHAAACGVDILAMAWHSPVTRSAVPLALAVCIEPITSCSHPSQSTLRRSVVGDAARASVIDTEGTSTMCGFRLMHSEMPSAFFLHAPLKHTWPERVPRHCVEAICEPVFEAMTQ